MGQSSLKANRRALRKTAREEKNNIVSRYMADNWDKVVVSAISLIRQFDFKNRLQISMTILFKPVKKTKQDKKITPDKKGVIAAPQEPQPSGAVVQV